MNLLNFFITQIEIEKTKTMKNTKIEWCDHTVNLWWGCTKVGQGCKNCYAETLANRFGNDIWGDGKERKLVKYPFFELSKLQNSAKKRGVRETVFVGSMMDIFEDLDKRNSEAELSRSLLFLNIENGGYDNLVFLFLTKRPQNVKEIVPRLWKEILPPDNVWYGFSVATQAEYDQTIGIIRHIQGNKFLSIEPQVKHIALGEKAKTVQWIIQGGESGRNRRPFDIEWARSMRDECVRLNIPYFFKQIDKLQEIPEDLQIREFPEF